MATKAQLRHQRRKEKILNDSPNRLGLITGAIKSPSIDQLPEATTNDSTSLGSIPFASISGDVLPPSLALPLPSTTDSTANNTNNPNTHNNNNHNNNDNNENNSNQILTIEDSSSSSTSISLSSIPFASLPSSSVLPFPSSALNQDSSLPHPSLTSVTSLPTPSIDLSSSSTSSLPLPSIHSTTPPLTPPSIDLSSTSTSPSENNHNFPSSSTSTSTASSSSLPHSSTSSSLREGETSSTSLSSPTPSTGRRAKGNLAFRQRITESTSQLLAELEGNNNNNDNNNKNNNNDKNNDSTDPNTKNGTKSKLRDLEPIPHYVSPRRKQLNQLVQNREYLWIQLLTVAAIFPVLFQWISPFYVCSSVVVVYLVSIVKVAFRELHRPGNPFEKLASIPRTYQEKIVPLFQSLSLWFFLIILLSGIRHELGPSLVELLS